MSVTPQQMQLLTRLGAGYTTNSGNGALGQTLGEVGTGIGAYTDLSQGTTTGDIGGAANLTKLGAQTGALGQLGLDKGTVGDINTGATGALDALGVYQGLEQGGWEGDAEAAGSALQGSGQVAGMLGDSALGGALSTAGGYVLAPLAVYNAVSNYQSGATGSDALNGAEAGAAIGSIVPGLGTLIGGVIGGAVGAISSAFGGGEADPETKDWNTYAAGYDSTQGNADQQAALNAVTTPAQSVQNLAGVMDAKDNSPGHAESIENVYGREGEGNFIDALGNEINQGYASGAINPNEDPSQQFTSVIQPWLAKQGVTFDPNSVTSKGVQEGSALEGTVEQLMGDYESGSLTPTSQVGVAGQTISGLNPFVGASASPQASAANTNAATTAFYGANNPNLASKLAPASTYQPATAAPATGNFNPGPSLGTMQASGSGFAGIAKGGLMKKDKRSALDHIIKGRPFHERKRFDDGGDVGGDNYLSYVNVSTPYATDPNPNESNDQAIVNLQQAAKTNPQIAQMLQQMGYSTSVTPGLTDVDYGSSGSGSGSKSGSGTQTGHTVSGDIDNLVNNTTNNGIYGVLKSLGAIAPLAALLLKPKTNTNPPTAAAGMSQGATNPTAPVGAGRTQVGASGSSPSSSSALATSPLGTLNPATASNSVQPTIGGAGSPSNLPGGAPMSLQDWYTYGSRPEATFFNNNSVPLAQATGIASGQAKGGSQHSPLDSLGGDFGMPEFDSAQQSHVEGPGDGTSDNIPAQLSDGEYVMDANTVSMLGNGSNKAGAARLDQLRQNLRKHAAKPMAKGKQFMKAKPPEQYMGGRAGRK